MERDPLYPLSSLLCLAKFWDVTMGCWQWYWKIRNISITLEMPRVAFQVHNLRLATALPAGSQNLSSISVILSVQKCPISIITQHMCRLGTGSFCFYLIAWTLIQVVCPLHLFHSCFWGVVCGMDVPRLVYPLLTHWQSCRLFPVWGC